MKDYMLSEAEQVRVQEWLEKRAGRFPCFCGGTSGWQLLPRVTIAPIWNPHTGRINYMDGYPAVALMCNSCGHLVYFSARRMGLGPDSAVAGAARPEEPVESQ